MITVGLVKELNFISTVLKNPVEATIKIGTESIVLKVNNNIFEVWYGDHHIWRERVEGDIAFFGIESCDTIFKIIIHLKNGEVVKAKDLTYFES